jgi:hypothetical protein
MYPMVFSRSTAIIGAAIRAITATRLPAWKSPVKYHRTARLLPAPRPPA